MSLAWSKLLFFVLRTRGLLEVSVPTKKVSLFEKSTEVTYCHILPEYC